jgi:hypothetical protein
MFRSSRPKLTAELHGAGVRLVDCPHNGKKEVVDKTIIGMFVRHQWMIDNVIDLRISGRDVRDSGSPRA